MPANQAQVHPTTTNDRDMLSMLKYDGYLPSHLRFAEGKQVLRANVPEEFMKERLKLLSVINFQVSN